MQVIHNAAELATAAHALGRSTGLGGVLVPTMGALHEGHARLIRRAVELSQGELGRSAGVRGPVVSIFVNPTQFNEAADFERYPRTLEADVALCAQAGASVVFAPDVGAMYPSPDAAPVPPLPEVAREPGLEDAKRPGHFAGVCQVVLRLFRLLEPALAVFGEKDWQQLQVVRAITREQALEVEIVAHATVRDPDGLAMSSRNRFLSAAERKAGLAIPRALRAAGLERDAAAAEAAMRSELARAALEVEYAVVRDAESLAGFPRPGRTGRALIAARSGPTRLIDNAPWPGESCWDEGLDLRP